MNTKPEYLIPANTAIQWRNVDHDLKLKRHVTEEPLRFEEIKCTGDGGLTYYFELGDWLIIVDADRVVRAAEVNEHHYAKPARMVTRNIISEHATSFQGSDFVQENVAYAPLLRLNRA